MATATLNTPLTQHEIYRNSPGIGRTRELTYRYWRELLEFGMMDGNDVLIIAQACARWESEGIPPNPLQKRKISNGRSFVQKLEIPLDALLRKVSDMDEVLFT